MARPGRAAGAGDPHRHWPILSNLDAPLRTCIIIIMIDEPLLIQRSLAGDVNAFNQLVTAYQNMAYSVAYRMLQESNASADAVQDSFVKAYRGLESYRGGSFKSWLMRIVTNTCYDALRSRGRRPTDSLDDLVENVEYAPFLTDKQESPPAYAERMELQLILERAIASLPEEQRLVLVLCDVEGYAYEEISEITGVAMGTVKSRISRARSRLRDYLVSRAPELLPSAYRPTER